MPSRPPAKQAVCILAMGKCGTSLMGNILLAAGVFLGREDELLANQMDNVMGYYENRRILAINEGILSHFGISWPWPKPLPARWHEDRALAPLYAAAEKIIADFYSVSNYICLKDPRFSLTYPFWQKILSPYRLRHIFMYRNPLEVVQSFIKYSQLPPATTLSLWTQHNTQCLAHLAGQDHIIVSYDDLMKNPAGVVNMVTGYLQLKIPRAKIAELCAIISPQFRHSEFTAAGVFADASVPSATRRLFRRLNRMNAAGRKRYKVRQIRKVAITPARQISELHRRIAKLDDLVRKQYDEIFSLRQKLGKR